MCIRMIPPEDVSVGTISATQASPITTTQCTASSCPSTTTAVRVNPVIVSPAVRVTPVIVSPVTTATGTVTTTPVTMTPMLCTNCDIAAIAPVMEANTVFENTNTVGANGCTQTNAICRRTDDQVCTGVILSATNAAGTSTIFSAMNANQVSGLLTCQADGTYSSGSVTGITKLMCTFDTCVPPCATCDIEAVKPLMNPPDSSFDITGSTPDGQACKRYVVTCRNMIPCPAINLYAEIGTGGEQLIKTEENGATSASAEVDCGNDAKLTFMGMFPVSHSSRGKSLNALKLEEGIYQNLGFQVCTTCDIAAIAPVMEANTVFENTNTVGADGCTQTNAICRRTDAQVSTEVTLSATNAAGTSTISSAMNANQVSGLLTFQADGTYSSGSVTGITKLVCTFVTSVPPCASCDIEAVRPLMDQPNSYFDIIDRTPTGQTCKVYQVQCNYNGVSCAAVLLYATIRQLGNDIEDPIALGNDVEMMATELACGNDGTLTFIGL
ncbi:hypothetical protein GCK72_021667 [Caenorhabditis remanei]|uniref:DUF281 domain-containing protein n=1 Tax=Caenorhabditis remanei TaxID=31234 RepID=A0A6A5GLE4_CAERE|nr:hypothetical protein GCK72_021667 [Caenorhabditis remanei]KAF1755099.1 hypothetical protein GCK72_021667 [Caenorhabditis remanei]